MQLHLIKLADIAHKCEYYTNLLSKDETLRMQRFASFALQQKFALTRGFLRESLGKYLDLAPHQLKFNYNEWGKPSLQNHSLQFNLAHSGDYCALAISPHNLVGVDIEKCELTHHSHIEIAKRFFTNNEYQVIANADNSEQIFFHVWTQKEAFLKAIGRGLAFGMEHFEVSTDINVAKILHIDDPEYQNRIWTSYALSPFSGYFLTVTEENDFEIPPQIINHPMSCPIEKIG